LLSSFDVGGGTAGLTKSLLSLANLNFTVNVTRTVPTMAPPGPVKLTEIDRKLAERRAQQAAAQETRQGASPSAVHPVDAQAAIAAIAAQSPALAAAAATVLGTSLPTAIATSAKTAATEPAKDAPDAAAPTAQFPEKCPTCIRKGSNNPAFYISWRSQKDIVSDLSKRSALYIVGGPALTIGCVAYLLAYFKVL
jgi:hypothetical protein